MVRFAGVAGIVFSSVAAAQVPQPRPIVDTVVRAVSAPRTPLPSEAQSAGVTKFSFIAYGDNPGHLTQIPIVINHEHKFISFGSQDPQLCFRYTLTDPADPTGPPTHLYQRFIFNLSWSPDDFKENQSAVESLFAWIDRALSNQGGN